MQITPWCDNSARVQIAPPATLPPPKINNVGALVDRALVDTCKSTSTGNLKVVQSGDSEITASRADTFVQPPRPFFSHNHELALPNRCLSHVSSCCDAG